MATKMEHLDLEIAHFNNFSQYIPGMNKCCAKTIRHILQLGLIQASTAFEQALAHQMGIKVVSEDSNDLSDGSDAKLSTVRTYGYGKYYGAPVTNIKGKTGDLLIQVYERKLAKFYYFIIPYNAYKHIPTKSNIEIPFELDGTPKRIPSRAVKVNWWKFEVVSLM